MITCWPRRRARERLLSSNAKAKERIGELQDFVARFGQ